MFLRVTIMRSIEINTNVVWVENIKIFVRNFNHPLIGLIFVEEALCCTPRVCLRWNLKKGLSLTNSVTMFLLYRIRFYVDMCWSTINENKNCHVPLCKDRYYRGRFGVITWSYIVKIIYLKLYENPEGMFS